MIISAAIQKGGCGKTTTTVNLAAFLAMRGQKTLLLDFDPQANATKTYLKDKIAEARKKEEVFTYKTIKDILIDKLPANEVIQETSITNLHILPSEIGLTKVEWKLMSEMEPNLQLRKAITRNELESQYDYIIIDSPPSLGILTVNALCTTNHVIIPVLCDTYATDGLMDLLDTIKVIQEGPNADLRLLGSFLNMYDKRLTLHQAIEADLVDIFKNDIFKTRVRDTIDISKAHAAGTPIFLYAKNSTAANDFGELFLEVLERIDSLFTYAQNSTTTEIPAAVKL